MKFRQIINTGILMIMMLSGNQVYGQTQKKLYDPALDGMKQINEAVAKAKSSGRHVLVQYGGNWCPWCLRFDAFCKADTAITKLTEDNYIAVKVNYSPENRNDAANVFMGNPARFGFPVFIIIDGKGKVIHIQDSAFLQEGKGYSRDNVIRFFKKWTAAAIIPNTGNRK